MRLRQNWLVVLILSAPLTAVAADNSRAQATEGATVTQSGDAQLSTLTGGGNSDADAAAESQTLGEVIVTAQRRTQDVQSVPISITALSQESLDHYGIQTFSDLAAVVPGLVISTPGDGAQAYSDIAIRGIYSNDNSPTTAIYINDTPVMIRQNFQAGYSGSPEPDIFDLERIEVLRGPQGTLFGASAMGGAIRYITHAPNMETSSGYAKANVGATDGGAPSYSAGAALGAPIVPDRLGFRASAWYQSSGGFVSMENPYSGAITRNANSASTYVIQGALTWAPVEALTVTPAIFVQRHHSDNSDQYWIDRSFLPNPDYGKDVVGANIQSPVDDHLGVYSLAIKYAGKDISFESDTSYLDRTYRDIDDWVALLPLFVGAPPGPFPGLSNVHPYDQNDSPTRQWVEQVRLASQASDSSLNWVVGAYFQHTEQETGQRISSLTPFTEALYGVSADDLFGIPEFIIDGQPFTFYTHYTTVDEDKAAFADLTWTLTRQFEMTAGIRVEQTSVIAQRQEFAGPIAGTAFSTAYPPDQRDTPVTPRLSLTYHVSENAMVYANAAKGFRAGGSNSPDVTDNPACEKPVEALGLTSVPSGYKSDSLWSYEIGTKNSLFDHRLIVDASAFYVNWKDIQTDVALSNCGEEFTTNRGKAISNGADLQVEAIPIHGLRIIGNVGYTHAYYPQAAYGSPFAGVTPTLNVAGEQLANVIPWTAALNVEYSWSIAHILPDARSYIRADYRYLDRVPSINGADTNYVSAIGPNISDAYDFLNLRLGVTRRAFEVSLFVDNVTRAHPRLNIGYFGFLSATAIRPLTAGVTAEYHF